MDRGHGFWGALLSLWRGLPWLSRALILSLMLLGALLLARIGRFGEELQAAARRAYPHCVAYLDDCSTYAPIEVAVFRKACGRDPEAKIIDGSFISIRDEIRLSVSARGEAWVSVLGQDGSNLYAVAPRERRGRLTGEEALEYLRVAPEAPWSRSISFDGSSDRETLIFASSAAKEWRTTASQVTEAAEGGAQARSLLPRGEERAAPGVLARSFTLRVAPWPDGVCP